MITTSGYAAHPCSAVCLSNTYVDIHVYTNVCAHAYTRVYIHMFIYTCLRTCLYTCLYACLYTCPYTGRRGLGATSVNGTLYVMGGWDGTKSLDT